MKQTGATVASPPHAPQSVEGSGPACTVETVNDYQGLLDLEPTWNRLADEAGIDHPFLLHEWMRTWWDCFGAGRTLHILVVKAGDEPIAIAPLMRRTVRLHGLKLRQLQFAWNVYAERFDFIVAKRASHAYRAIWDHLLSERALWDVVVLPQLPSGSRTLEELPRLAGESRLPVGLWSSGRSPYLPLSGSWDAYLERLAGKHRSNLRNRMKRLRGLGTVSLEVVSSTAHLAQALEDGFRIEAAAWKGRAQTAIQVHPDVQRFYTGLAAAAARQGWLRLAFLTVDGQRIAFAYYLEYGKKLYLLKPGYDPRFAAYSPSNLLCSLMLEDGFRRGLTELDFLAEADRWKLDWTDCVRPHYWLYLYSDRLKSRLLHWAKFRILPRLKQRRVVQVLLDRARRRQGAAPGRHGN